MDLTRLRLGPQRLAGNPLRSASEVVRWLGAVQAQDYSGAKWAIGLRTKGATEEEVERALTDGRILRTHLMRPTWHFVDSEDIRWMLELTSPRVKVRNSYMHRKSGLDEETFTRSNEAIEKALKGGRALTRVELKRAISEAGISASGTKLTYLMMRAELDALVCSGPRRNRQFTYALLDERGRGRGTMERDDALKELARRYFTSHGPATIKDFVQWSGLTVKDARSGLEAASNSLTKEEIGGEAFWSPLRREPAEVGGAILLPTYDELFVGYSSFDSLRRGGEGATWDFIHSSPLLLEGSVAGTWRRILTKREVLVEVAPRTSLSGDEAEKVEKAVQRYGRFLDLSASCIIKRK